ncbi:MAG: phosphatase PAP2 family protein [Gelidibacter sp.]|nr:phosphatase PAP2 family protein [Gelidibacter sp.]
MISTLKKLNIASIVLFLFIVPHSKSLAQQQIEESGDIIQLALPISALASTLIWPENQSTLLEFTKSMGASIIITHSLKVMIDKDRPNGAKDGHSFPSGHTSAAFTGATFLQLKYGWEVGVPSYLLATYVAWTRVKVKRHDPWDVIGGALTGFGCAHLFKNNKKIEINISKLNDNLLVGLVVKY